MNDARRGTAKRSAGFTLPEMLVVIGVIGVLIALLMPVVNRARGSARRAVCASQLHQIYLAAQSWQHAQTGPTGVAPEIPAQGWRSMFRPHLQTSAIYTCPSDTLIGTDDLAAGSGLPDGGQMTTTPPPPVTPAPPPPKQDEPTYVGEPVDNYAILVNGMTIPIGPGPRAKVLNENVEANPYINGPLKFKYGYTLGIEVGGDDSYDDLVITVGNMGDFAVQIGVVSKNSNARFDLVQTAKGTWWTPGMVYTLENGSHCQSPGYVPPVHKVEPPAPDPTPTTPGGETAGGGGAPQLPGTPGFAGESSYGLNAAANRVFGDATKVFALDYRVSVADVVDNWMNRPFAAEGRLLFARHAGRVNVLRGDGSVELSDAPKAELDPAVAENVRRWWLP